MKTETLSLYEIRTIGSEALIRELGITQPPLSMKPTLEQFFPAPERTRFSYGGKRDI